MFIRQYSSVLLLYEAQDSPFLTPLSCKLWFPLWRSSPCPRAVMLLCLDLETSLYTKRPSPSENDQEKHEHRPMWAKQFSIFVLFLPRPDYLQVLGSNTIILSLDLFEGGRQIRQREGHIYFSHRSINLSHQLLDFLTCRKSHSNSTIFSISITLIIWLHTYIYIYIYILLHIYKQNFTVGTLSLDKN